MEGRKTLQKSQLKTYICSVFDAVRNALKFRKSKESYLNSKMPKKVQK